MLKKFAYFDICLPPGSPIFYILGANLGVIFAQKSFQAVLIRTQRFTQCVGKITCLREKGPAGHGLALILPIFFILKVLSA